MAQDKRVQRYQDDAKFHALVKQMENVVDVHGFTHQDLQDAAFVAMMFWYRRNPTPMLGPKPPWERE